MSTLMFWNKQNANNNQNNSEAKNGKKNWIHAPDTLLNGHVAYLVKFLGNTAVDQAKGIETVKDAIRRLQFAQQIKKAESGNNVKTKKVEITVSVDGVAIQEPRTQKILHQFPLHNISYCADEKGVKKFFSFIAKTNIGNGSNQTGDSTSTNGEDTHECFVFISSKLASDITLTIGQAFELAYRRYMNDGGKMNEITKLQSSNKMLENTVVAYRQRLKELAEILPKSELDRFVMRLGLRDILDVPQENGNGSHDTSINGNKTPDLGIDVSHPSNDDQLLIEASPKHFAPIVPPRNIQNQLNNTLDALKPSVGTKLEGLLLNSDSDSDFDPRADENESNRSTGNGNNISNDLFGFEPPKSSMGQQLFNPVSNSNFVNNNNSINNGHSAFMTNGNAMNGSAPPTSPPPLLAPPPKAATPRRSTSVQQNSSQDLFGSEPFNGTISNNGFGGSMSSDGFNGSLKNPFNDSGASSMSSESGFGRPGFNEVSAFANNVDKFDETIKAKLASGTIPPFASYSSDMKMNHSIPNETNHKFPINGLDNLNGIDFQKPLNGIKSFTKNHNYETLRETINAELIASEAQAANNVNTSNDFHDNEKLVKVDKFFKDAAASAFGEFNKTSKSINEFSNPVSFSGSMLVSTKYNTGKNDGHKAFMDDDFSLESLDPLRK